MSFVRTWDVDKYKTNHESDEHWELRKRFMETHKDKFPEDKLVCLAQVFVNVEFLGCMYPEKTMKIVADLSKGVADEHREKQKGKLKRTFVKASDAAEAKIKRASSSGEPPSKLLKPNQTQDPFQYTCFVHAELAKPVESGEFPGFIIYENCNYLGIVETCPINILTQSAQKNPNWNTMNFNCIPAEKKANNGCFNCEIKLNNKVLASGTGSTIKEAKVNAATEGLNILRKTCYTIQAKCAFFSENPSVGKDGAPVKEADLPLPEDNVGSKIMQKMGWTGSGLGKQQQGIQEPVKASSQIVQRSGLGCDNPKQFHNRFRNMFKDYIASGSDSDLVFTSDFTPEERKTLHKLAQHFQLKTRSYGKDQNRHLVVYKVLALPVILDLLLASGGENDKYLLILPTGDDTLCPEKSMQVVADEYRENQNGKFHKTLVKPDAAEEKINESSRGFTPDKVITLD